MSKPNIIFFFYHQLKGKYYNLTLQNLCELEI